MHAMEFGWRLSRMSLLYRRHMSPLPHIRGAVRWSDREQVICNLSAGRSLQRWEGATALRSSAASGSHISKSFRNPRIRAVLGKMEAKRPSAKLHSKGETLRPYRMSSKDAVSGKYGAYVRGVTLYHFSHRIQRNSPLGEEADYHHAAATKPPEGIARNAHWPRFRGLRHWKPSL